MTTLKDLMEGCALIMDKQRGQWQCLGERIVARLTMGGIEICVAVLARLGGLTWAECAALIDDVERFWAKDEA